jgi:hypothetical protein
MSALMQGGSALARSEEHWSMCFESLGSPTVGVGQARSTLFGRRSRTLKSYIAHCSNALLGISQPDSAGQAQTLDRYPLRAASSLIYRPTGCGATIEREPTCAKRPPMMLSG